VEDSVGHRHQARNGICRVDGLLPGFETLRRSERDAHIALGTEGRVIRPDLTCKEETVSIRQSSVFANDCFLL
jgi:hypothetical protein